MRVVSLRRYPVKSMGGEALEAAHLDLRGLRGDRWYAVSDEDGCLASGKSSRRFRRRDQVFAYAARTTSTDDVAVTGPGGEWLVGDPALEVELSGAMGVPVRVTSETEVSHQDDGSVSLVGTATLDWWAGKGIAADPRRLRVNIVVSTDEPFVEESWVGRALTMGSASLRVVGPVPRCRMIDIDQDGAVADGGWLKPLTEQRDGCVSVYADVLAPGVVRVGEPLTLSDPSVVEQSLPPVVE